MKVLQCLGIYWARGREKASTKDEQSRSVSNLSQLPSPIVNVVETKYQGLFSIIYTVSSKLTRTNCVHKPTLLKDGLCRTQFYYLVQWSVRWEALIYSGFVFGTAEPSLQRTRLAAPPSWSVLGCPPRGRAIEVDPRRSRWHSKRSTNSRRLLAAVSDSQPHS